MSEDSMISRWPYHCNSSYVLHLNPLDRGARQLGAFSWGNAADHTIAHVGNKSSGPVFPTTGADLLHLLEDVHMHMFLGMIMYFGSVFHLVRRTVVDILANFEHAERGLIDDDWEVEGKDSERSVLYQRCKRWMLHGTENTFGRLGFVVGWKSRSISVRDGEHCFR